MWCPQCQTQVAGIASPREQSALVCAKCQTRLSTDSKSTSDTRPSSEASVPLPGMRLDTHRMQATLSRVDQLVQRFGETADFQEVAQRIPAKRASQPQALPDPADSPDSDDSFPLLASLSLAGGVMLLVCGCFLVVWSVVAKRPELFNIGFPIAVISLACMALAACLFFQDASGKQAETQKWLADVQNQLGGIRDIANNSRHTLGSIPDLPESTSSPTNDRLAEAEERLNALRRRLNQSRSH
ncbi:hypothetical protein [Bremerella sp. P1]|uniref:hypothetical protein n=1 Tax=Bremerella sp. P1 TaxID=3026424 RepID=UPI002367A60C|nr:hypothetical protein [Bremerella sp. P1]WDI42812.1 hypothetical protein PSR63_02490 [Bremerella sp. P1]